MATGETAVHSLLESGEPVGSRRRARTQVVLSVLETWIDELRNAPQATMRESVERQVGALPASTKGRAVSLGRGCGGPARTGY